jgi:hypothetical protein
VVISTRLAAVIFWRALGVKFPRISKAINTEVCRERDARELRALAGVIVPS